MIQGISTDKLLWDSTAFDNNYADIMVLVESIRERGLVDPRIIVTPLGDFYRIVSGRNTARAATMLGYKLLPCHVQEMDEQQIMELRIVEGQFYKPGYHGGRNYHVYRPGY